MVNFFKIKKANIYIYFLNVLNASLFYLFIQFENDIIFIIYYKSIIIEIFNQFIAKKVFLQYTLYIDRKTNLIIILDNVKIYISQKLDNICKTSEILLAYFLSYSYDYNPIKTFFALLKYWIKKHADITKIDNQE